MWWLWFILGIVIGVTATLGVAGSGIMYFKRNPAKVMQMFMARMK